MVIKHMDIKEFREIGLLQEVNRLFFHPRGVALEVVISDNGTESLGGIWDSRNDPEGMLFDVNMIEEDKIKRVEAMLERHVATRQDMFNSDSIIQEEVK